MKVSFPPNIRAGSLVRTTHASILWKKGLVGLVIEIIEADMGRDHAMVAFSTRHRVQHARVGPHSIEVIT